MPWIAKLRNLCQALGQFRRAKLKASERAKKGRKGEEETHLLSPAVLTRFFALFFDLHYLGAWNRLRNSRRSREGGQQSRQTGARRRNLQWNFIKFRGEVIKLKAIEFLLIAKQIMLAVKASWLASKTSTCFNKTENWIWNQLYFVLSAYSNKDLHKSFWKFSFHGYWVYWYGLTLRYNEITSINDSKTKKKTNINGQTRKRKQKRKLEKRDLILFWGAMISFYSH